MSNVGLSFEEGSTCVGNTIHRLTPRMGESLYDLEAACWQPAATHVLRNSRFQPAWSPFHHDFVLVCGEWTS